MSKPLVPRGWKTTGAIHEAKKPFLSVFRTTLGKKTPAFNGSGTSRRTKKRPITLPAISTESKK